MAKNPQKLFDLQRDNEQLLVRYHRLLTYRQYQEPLELGIWMPLLNTSVTLDLNRLYLLSLGQQAHLGNIDAAVQGAKQVMAFWQAMANTDTSLMMKFHAFAALRSSLYLVSELSALPGLTDEKREELTQALQFGASLTAPALADYLKKQSGASPIQVRKLDLAFVYNPLGEAQAIKSYNLQYSGYARRVHNLEGIRRLAQLTLKASEQRVTPETMQAFLATAGPI